MTIVIVVFKQKTAYEMRISDWSSDVCSSDLQLVDVRTQLFAVHSMRAGAVDDYALVRDAWLQRRNYQIFAERDQTIEESLSDYLREASANPTVPVEAIPIIQGHRKSGVQGKRVSVRVGLGGIRLNQKNTKTIHYNNK